MSAIIYWENPLTCEMEIDQFDALEAALEELEIFKVKYPWNTYVVAQDVLVHKATKEFPHPYRHTISGGIAK